MIATCRERNEIMYYVTNKIVTIEDHKSGFRISHENHDESYFSVIDNAFNNLIESEDKIPESYKFVVDKLKAIYNIDKNNIELNNRDEKKGIENFLFYMKNTKDWYSSWILNEDHNYMFTEETYDFFLNDPMYFNYAADFTNIACRDKFDKTHLFRAHALESYRVIDTILSKENKSYKWVSPMESYDVEDYHQFVDKYKSEWGIAEIKIEDHKLNYYWNGAAGISFVSEIFPTSVSDFTLESAREPYLFSLTYNENDEVTDKYSDRGARSRDYSIRIK